MIRKENQISREDLLEEIIEAIKNLKGQNILKLDLQELEYAECDYYIVCEGTSSTQVDSIAKSVQDHVLETLGEKAWHVDGYQNAEWILIDYMDIMVHVFQPEVRKRYDIETLWADAKVEKCDDDS